MEEAQITLDFGPGRRIYTVAELNGAIRALFDSHFQSIWVSGEISGVKLASSGHYYFTLKDEQTQLRCACFRAWARYLRFKPQDGIAVIARGRIDVYEARGEYQLLVEALEPQGYGALQLAFEQLKKKLADEGLFAPERKRALPQFPGRIGIVTSATGAAIRDILRVLQWRFRGLHVRLYPVQVQGTGSVEEVVVGLDFFSRSGWPDVVILARGGGSLEDLWTFNEEAVARAIARCAVPVVAAIGHETDVTIADFVADLRAPTPSAAAELVVRTRQQLVEQVENAAARVEKEMRYRFADAARRLYQQGVERAASVFQRSLGRLHQRVDDADFRLRRLDPRLRLSAAQRRQELASSALHDQVRLKLLRARAGLDALAAQLAGLSPLSVLDRGYAIVQDEAGGIAKNAADTPAGSQIDVRLAKGRLVARVTRVTPAGNSELPS